MTGRDDRPLVQLPNACPCGTCPQFVKKKHETQPGNSPVVHSVALVSPVETCPDLSWPKPAWKSPLLPSVGCSHAEHTASAPSRHGGWAAPLPLQRPLSSEETQANRGLASYFQRPWNMRANVVLREPERRNSVLCLQSSSNICLYFTSCTAKPGFMPHGEFTHLGPKHRFR